VKVYHGFLDPALKKKRRSVAIGIFDGVHLAHRRILKNAIRAAKTNHAVPLVVTFDPHPQKVLSGNKKNPPILMSLEHRLRVMASLGIEEALVVRFDKKFSKMTREVFLRSRLLGRLGMVSLAVGHDFCFGRNAAGGLDYLSQEAKRFGFKLSVCPAVRARGKTVSSTMIRRLIEGGSLAKARLMLGRPVSIFGTVIHGRGRGKKVGFPTANLDPHHETLPPEGVYAVRGRLNKRLLLGVLHIGKRPTFSDTQKSVEVHWLDWSGNLYGREIELFFMKKIRPTRRFASARALERAIRKDILAAGLASRA